MNWFESFLKRLLSDTPSFFAKIIYFGITLGSIGAGIMGLKGTLDIPYWLVDQADNMVIIGAVAAIVAKSTVKRSNPVSQ
jgi:hypothetical protein